MRHFLLLFLFLCPTLSAFELATTSDEKRTVRWNDWHNIPFQFEAHSPAAFRRAVKDCMAEWSDATGGVIGFVQGSDVSQCCVPLRGGLTFTFQRTPTQALADAVNGGSTERHSDPSTGYLLFVHVVLNGKYFKWHRGAPTLKTSRLTVDPFGSQLVYDWSYDYILLHEIGHALGLDHNDLIDSVMYGRAGHKLVGSDDVAGVTALFSSTK